MSVGTASTVLTGGKVFDPSTGKLSRQDVAVSGGRIVGVGPDLTCVNATQCDVSGLIVTPGLVDMHAHVFAGQDLGVDPDVVGPRSGTTTFVDTGSAGAHLIEAFYRGTIRSAIPRIVALLNISSIGATSILLAGELENLRYSDEGACVAAAQRFSGVVRGVKVRASANVAGGDAREALYRARRAADSLELPLMVHLGPAPPSVDEVLSILGPGDIVTHCFTSCGSNTLAPGGRAHPALHAARDRGVLFDVGHGMGGFDSDVAAALLSEGFAPDTISTDLHAYSMAEAKDLPTVLSKFLALGMSLEAVLTRSTINAARAIGLDGEGVGTLRPGAAADLALFQLGAGRWSFVDPQGHRFKGTNRLRCVMTLRAGEVVFDGRESPASVRDKR